VFCTKKFDTSIDIIIILGLIQCKLWTRAAAFYPELRASKPKHVLREFVLA
jgi:hypothetical protein